MAKRQIPKKAKRRLIVFGPLCIFLIGYCLFTLVTAITDLYSLNKQEKELETNLKELKSDAKELKTEITKLQDKDYIARYARENYLYTKDGEYVIKTEDEEETTTTKATNNDNYIIYTCIGTFLLITIFIIHKSRKRKK